ncbi:MAG TPA: potassium channel protein [Terriglobia bacterium]|nr:potassium channel protein [Terriglobia bacterium]
MKGIRTAVLIVALLAALIGVGTVGFHLVQGWGWFQSLYTTLMTLSTIGAGPENELSRRGQVFNVVLILLGVGTVGFAIGALTRAVIEFELGSFFGRRRMEKEISALNNHFIICGVGRVGRRVAAEVSARKYPLVIIEKDPARAAWAQEHGFPVIIGDAASENVLRKARIEHARALASAVTSDAQNVYIVLTARGIAPDIPIVARASEEDAESKLMRAGATTVVSPYSYAGQRIARILTRPYVQRFIDMALSSLSETNLEIEEVKVGNPSSLAGKNLGEADIRERFGLIVLAIRHQDGQLDFNPKPSQTISSGDYLIVMGSSQNLRQLESVAGVKE